MIPLTLRFAVSSTVTRTPSREYFDLDRREMGIVAIIRKGPDPKWGVLVGEIIHNLRSALDHLVWELVVLETGEGPITNKTQFPIFRTEHGKNAYDGRGERVYLHGVGDTAKALIRSKQPFSTGEDVESPLWKLLRLSDFDKHRTLHLMGAMLYTGRIKFPFLAQGVEPIDTFAREPGPFENETILAWLRVSGTGWPFVVPEDQVSVEGHTSFDVAFDERNPDVRRARVIPTLAAIGERVNQIIEQIAAEIFGLSL